MSEQRLRELLEQAVPEAPDLDPAAIVRRADKGRRSTAAVVAGSAVVLVIASGALAMAGFDADPRVRPLTGTTQTGGPLPSDVATAPSESDAVDGPLAPYEVPQCPARLPDFEVANRSVADLDGVVAVRLCPDLNPRGDQSWVPRPEQLAQLEDADALVRNVDGFIAELRSYPDGLPEYCTTDEGPYVGQSFAFYRTEGTRVLMATRGCELVEIEGDSVHGGALRESYIEALDRQRDGLTYARPFDDELTCHTQERGGPVRPGRERLIAAVACDLPPGAQSIPMDLEPAPLDLDQLAELDQAWARPGDPIVRGASGEHECVDLEEPPSFIIAATDRSDVVQLIDSPCGFLVWHGWENHEGATFPTTLGKLGLE